MGRTVRGFSPRNIWSHYRSIIALSFLVFVCGEVAVGIAVVNYSEWSSDILIVLIFLSISISQFIAGAYFIVQARSLAGPLLGYMENPESNPRPENERRVRAFVNWVQMSSASMILNTASSSFYLIALAAGALTPSGPMYYFPASLVVICSRVMTTLSQVRLLPVYQYVCP